VARTGLLCKRTHTAGFSLNRRFLALLLLCLPVAVYAATRLEIGQFSDGSLDGWKSKSFVGETEYSLVEQDGRMVLLANSVGSASVLGRKIKIDLTETPYVNWSWKVERGLPKMDETTKGGDDFAARLYFVKSGGVAIWNTKALNYVWAGSQLRDTSWPNAFEPNNSIMHAVRGSWDPTGEWRQEKRNVREDFKKSFGKDIKSINAVAIMTDTDNTGLRARAVYGDIYFTAN